jgi:hypothetical protein
MGGEFACTPPRTKQIVVDSTCWCIDPNLPVTGPEGETFEGFREIRCYESLLPSTPACIPVAARPFDETVPAQALDPTQGEPARRVGFTFVGIYDPQHAEAKGSPAAALPQATPQEVKDGFRRFSGVPVDTLFACMGSVEFANDGSVAATTDVLYGFRLVASYVRAEQQAARTAFPTDLPIGDFSDALGLIRKVRTPASSSAFLPALLGWTGSIYDRSRWGNTASAVTQAQSEDLPDVFDQYLERSCYRSLFGASTLTGPFGPEVVLFGGGLPSATSCMFSFAGGKQALIFTKLPFAVGEAIEGRQLVDWGDFFQTAALEEIGHIVGLPSIDQNGPLTYPRAVDEFAELAGGDADLSSRSTPTWQLKRPVPPTPPPFHAMVAPAGAGKKIPSGAYLASPPLLTSKGKWVVVDGAFFSALRAADMQYDAPVIYPSSATGTTALPVTDTFVSAGYPQLRSQRFDEDSGSWRQEFQTWQGRADGLSVSLPVSTAGSKQPYNFGVADSSVFNVHYEYSKFYPGGDEWLTNSASTTCSLTRERFLSNTVIASHSQNTIATAWCNDRVPSDPQGVINTYSKRVELCANARPGVAQEHWTRLATRVPFAGVFGQPGEFPDVALGTFPSGDLVRAVIDGPQLHEGLDVNWRFRSRQIAPGYSMIGQVTDACFGVEPTGISEVEVPLSCSNEIIQECGADAGCDNGCNPFEQDFLLKWKDRIEQHCVTVCESEGCASQVPVVGSFLSAVGADEICDLVSCTANVLTYPLQCGAALGAGWAEALVDTVTSYLDPLCVGLTGELCSDELTLHHCPPRESAYEHELEYNFAFGAIGYGNGYASECSATIPILDVGKCTYDSYTRANLLGSGSLPLVDVDDSLRAIGELNDGALASNKVWPFTFAPGIFNNALGAWGRMSLRAGPSSGAPAIVEVLPSFARQLIDREGDAIAERGMRIAFLGDLIVDCGHNPLHQEIHPPLAMMLHASTSTMAFAKRYSLFGWHRRDEDRNDIVFELWPPRRLVASAAIGAKDLITAAGEPSVPTGIVLDGSSTPGFIVCRPFPEVAPSRLRCVLSPGAGPISISFADCSDSPRMLPACATDIAGGLVEVRWQ